MVEATDLEHVLPQRADRYLRSPRLTRSERGVELSVIAWAGLGSAREEVLSFDVGRDGVSLSLGEPRVAETASTILDLRNADRVELAEHATDEDHAWHRDARVSIEREAGRSRVILHDTRRTVVWEGFATASAPALATTQTGTWVAFHHNQREDTGEPDLSKWIAVFFVDHAGDVFEPAAPMTDRDRDREGEEQGFEFPTLVVAPSGALTLFGRGSHRFWRQDLDAAGFGARVPLGTSGDWGCRGRRAHALVDEERILVARRERPGIVLASLPLPVGGAPALQRRDLSPSPAARPSRLRPAASDPAERWERRTLFGDIHQHSAHSDGCGTAHEPYLRARHLYGDDFCALSDHESFLGKRIGPGEWSYLERVAEQHDAPGAFATLFAYEWTGKSFPGPGHKVVYSDRPGTEVVSRDAEPTGQGLIRKLKASGSIAVPHHVGWTGADEAAHDPEVQPVWEICSCHGCYLTAQHPLGGRGDLRDQMVEEVLKRGARFGFIACSDGHGLLFHHGVGRKRDPFRTGLTAVQARSNDRTAILAALRERRSYATSGVPIYLDVDAEGRPMGSQLGGPSQIVVRAAGCAPIKTLSLVGPLGVIASVAPNAIEATLEARLEAPHAWAYARVEQVDGEMAWSSPVWLASL